MLQGGTVDRKTKNGAKLVGGEDKKSPSPEISHDSHDLR
jgi:hypothetical protein